MAARACGEQALKNKPQFYSRTPRGIGAALAALRTAETIMRTVFVITTAAAALFSSPALAQQSTQGTAPIPDFSGLWAHPYIPGFEPPSSGSGPVVNKSRFRQGPYDVSNFRSFVGDYANPILKPLAVEAVKKHGEFELSGGTAPTPANQC
jgi:hypothetical protein